ncbi:MAG: T9SS type A sorting domain-containing protein [Chitinophagaceae bacterium]
MKFEPFVKQGVYNELIIFNYVLVIKIKKRMKAEKLKFIKLLFFMLLSVIQTVDAQKLLFPSSYGGTQSSGAIIGYDIANNQLSTLSSLNGSPLTAWDPLGFDGEEAYYRTGMIRGQDGYFYGIGQLESLRSNYATLIPTTRSMGVFYRFDGTTGEIKVLHHFLGSGENAPDRYQLLNVGLYNDFTGPVWKVLETSPGVFYGVAKAGGQYNKGGVWKYNANTNTYTNVVSFNDTGGGLGIIPLCPLIKGDGNYLYGALKRNNGLDYGYLYKVNTATDQVQYVTDLSPAGLVLERPTGDILYNASTKTIYGTKDRWDASSNWGGGIWKYQITNGTVTNEFSVQFSQINSLGSRVGGIVEGADGNYYVTTGAGGAYNSGTILKYYPSNSTVVKVFDFPPLPLDTKNSVSGLFSNGTKIFGTYEYQDFNGIPFLWSFDIVTSAFKDLMFYNKTDPNHPGGCIDLYPVVYNGDLYGKTGIRSSGGAGAFFKYNILAETTTILRKNNGREGRNFTGELALLNNTTALGWTASGGYNSDSTKQDENGDLVKIDLVSGAVSKLKDATDPVFMNDDFARSLKHNRPFIASNGKVLYSIITERYAIGQRCWLYIYDTTTSIYNFRTMGSISSYFTGDETIGVTEDASKRIYYTKFDSIKVLDLNTLNDIASLSWDAQQYGGLIGNLHYASNGKIYGQTRKREFAGGNSRCVIYSINPANNFQLTIEYQFPATIPTLNVGLTELNGKLYGSTNFGGTNSIGYLYSFDLATKAVTVLQNFNKNTDGSVFSGQWTPYGGKLYAVSHSGGSNGAGTLVSFTPATSTFTTLKHLDMSNGLPYIASPMVWDDTNIPVSVSVSVLGSTALCPGDSVILRSSKPTGNTWSTGATTQSITVKTAGTYTVTYREGNKTATSSPITVSVLGISGQPLNQSVVSYADAEFRVTQSAPNTQFQWQTDFGIGWQNLTNSGIYSGVTTDRLKLSRVSIANNGHKFRCIVSSGTCNITSGEAQLTIINFPFYYPYLYPNPVINSFTVVGVENIETVEIINTIGQIIKTTNNSGIVNVTSLSPGIYFVRVTSQGKVYSLKMIKK